MNKMQAHEMALKCKTKSEFRLKYSHAYNFARLNGHLADICSHMIPTFLLKSQSRTIWTYKACKKEALKYDNRSDFMRKSSRAYNVALSNGWIVDICSHMELRHKPNGFWTKEKCAELAKQCNTIKEFREKHSSAYVTAKRKMWLRDITNHIDVKKRKWEKHEVIVESKKYKTKIEFAKKASGAYTACLNNNWLKYCDKHFIKMIDNREERLQKQILKQLLKIAKKYKLEIIREQKVVINKNKYCRPDFLVKSKLNNKFVVVEVKHDDSTWSRKDIQKQVKMYNQKFKGDKKFKETIVVSNIGKYGMAVKNLDQEILRRLK